MKNSSIVLVPKDNQLRGIAKAYFEEGKKISTNEFIEKYIRPELPSMVTLKVGNDAPSDKLSFDYSENKLEIVYQHGSKSIMNILAYKKDRYDLDFGTEVGIHLDYQEKQKMKSNIDSAIEIVGLKVEMLLMQFKSAIEGIKFYDTKI
jgi:hypothetical protein